jgi:acid stress-induced BolA-like protein IbaG/YrbA
MIAAEQIRAWIEAGLPECRARVEGDDGTHFNAAVVCPAFRGKTLLQQQRMVYATLGDRIVNGEIHALSLKTYTPEDWARLANLQGTP